MKKIRYVLLNLLSSISLSLGDSSNESICVFQPRDQFVSRLLKKLKIEDNQPEREAEKIKDDIEEEDTWENLISDEDVR